MGTVALSVILLTACARADDRVEDMTRTNCQLEIVDQNTGAMLVQTGQTINLAIFQYPDNGQVSLLQIEIDGRLHMLEAYDHRYNFAGKQHLFRSQDRKTEVEIWDSMNRAPHWLDLGKGSYLGGNIIIQTPDTRKILNVEGVCKK